MWQDESSLCVLSCTRAPRFLTDRVRVAARDGRQRQFTLRTVKEHPMAVPKFKMSRARTHSRRSQWKA
ncbi:MAG: 50S ribosomal protein L32, partial [Brachybacterium sp.]